MNTKIYNEKVVRILAFMICIIAIFSVGCGTKEEEIFWQEDEAVQENKGVSTENTFNEDTSREEGVSEESMSAKEAPARMIYVHITGAVCNAGVYQVAEDARVFEVIELAGGFSDEAYEAAVNQAEAVSDGQKITIPTKEEWEAGLADALISGENRQAGNGQEDGLVNINTADETLLCTLSGVGSARAQAIIAYREEHGAFQTIEDIKKVTGIKDGLYNKIKDKIKV